MAVLHSIYEPPLGDKDLTFHPQTEGLTIGSRIDPFCDMDHGGRWLCRNLVGPGKKVDEVLGDVRVTIRILMKLADGHKAPLEPGQIAFSVGHILHGKTPLTSLLSLLT